MDDDQEWRLNIRADYHYKLQKLHCALKLWQQRHNARRHERERTRLAKIHYKQRTLSSVFDHWQRYVCGRRRKNRLAAKAAKFYNFWLQRCTLRLWQSAYVQLLDTQALLADFRQVSSRRRLSQTLLHWQIRYQKQCTSRLLIQQFAARRHLYLARRMLRRWRQHKLHMDKQRVMNKAADVLRTRFLYQSPWQKWRAHLSLLQERKHRATKATIIGIAACQRRVYQHWRAYCHARRRKAHLTRIGDMLYAGKALRLWRQRLKYRRFRQQQYMQACKHADCRSMAMAWKYWAAGFDHVKELQLDEPYRAVLHACQARLVAQAWQKWQRYTNDQLLLAGKLNVARNRWRRKILPRVFEAWRLGVSNQQREKTAYQQANSFAWQRQVRLLWHHWQQQLLRRRIHAAQVELAETYHERHRLAHTWRLWLRARRLLRQWHRKNAMADQLHIEQLARRCLHAWYGQVQRAKAIDDMHMYATAYRHQRMLAAVVVHWRRVTSARRASLAKAQQAQHHHESGLLRGVWALWKRARARRQHVRITLVTLNQLRQRRLARSVVSRWKQHVLQQQALRHKQHQAQQFYQRALINTAYQAWKAFVVEQQDTRAYDADLLALWDVQKRRRLLSRSVQRWQAKLEERSLAVADAVMAQQHLESTLVYQAWMKWTALLACKQKQRGDDRRARSFAQRQLLQHAWRLWHASRPLKALHGERTRDSLSLWAYGLQRRRLRQWRAAYRHRQCIAQRKSAALDRRRRRITMATMAQLLKYEHYTASQAHPLTEAFAKLRAEWQARQPECLTNLNRPPRPLRTMYQPKASARLPTQQPQPSPSSASAAKRDKPRVPLFVQLNQLQQRKQQLTQASAQQPPVRTWQPQLALQESLPLPQPDRPNTEFRAPCLDTAAALQPSASTQVMDNATTSTPSLQLAHILRQLQSALGQDDVRVTDLQRLKGLLHRLEQATTTS
eukprot:TRINITY_DN9830_c0_g1_i1.p1 TRINITY_DN9830_c0_g1~~TRINITY_DN9830_c0_g1_i1.p1  ORF type:complete len:956 (+),score=151.78 TRINITY_DN9830_c0_g1_i1:135-3002(+)